MGYCDYYVCNKPYNCLCMNCRNKYYYHNFDPYYGPKMIPNYFYPDSLPNEKIFVTQTKEEPMVNVNLNFFLKILGAKSEVISDDSKTLEFMFDIKRKLQECGHLEKDEQTKDEVAQ